MPLEPGRYVCVATPGFVGWLIRKVTRSAVNHAFAVTGPDEIVEARPEGTCKGTLSQYAGAYAVANTGEPVTQKQRDAVAAKALTLVGTPYNFPSILDIGLEDLGWHWRLLMRFARADRELICSQMVAVAGAAAGLDWSCGKPSPDQVTPGDLARRPGVRQVTISA